MGQGFQKLEPKEDTQTHRQTRLNTLWQPHSRVEKIVQTLSELSEFVHL